MFTHKPDRTTLNMAHDDRGDATRLDSHEYAMLAAFRYALRGFMHFSETAAAGVGLTAQHYQAMLVVRGCPADRRITINDLAQQLLIRHNSAVGLVDRLHRQGLVAREPSPLDGRKVHLRLTAKGERVLERLASVHREELSRIGPQLRQLLQQITRATKGPPRSD
jgi:DNA-binding MarR family transcriptional regulator